MLPEELSKVVVLGDEDHGAGGRWASTQIQAAEPGSCGPPRISVPFCLGVKTRHVVH